MVATVVLREEHAYTSIDVDFTDKNKHRNIVINDDFGIVMAAVGHSGMFLASKGSQNGGPEDEELDDFIRPDDEDMDMDDNGEGADEKRRKKYSHVQFKPFNTWKNLKDWHFSLKYGE